MLRRSVNKSRSAASFRNGHRKMRRENFAIMRGGWRL